MQSQILFTPQGFNCPISQTIMKDPVVTVDGHTFQRQVMQQWFSRGNNINPLTGLPLQKLILIPNLALKDVMLEVLPWIKEKQEQKKNLQKTLCEFQKMWTKDLQLVNTNKGQEKQQNVQKTKIYSKEPQENLFYTLQKQMNQFAFNFSKWQNKCKGIMQIDEEVGLYKGQLKRNKLKHGNGVIKFKNYFQRQKSLHGEINRQRFSGDIYKGQFLDGNQQGKGIIYYNNKQIFYCNWKNNKPDGLGLRIKNNKRIIQIWQNGMAVIQEEL